MKDKEIRNALAENDSRHEIRQKQINAIIDYLGIEFEYISEQPWKYKAVKKGKH